MISFFGDASCADEPDLALFRYKKEDKKIMSNNDSDNDIKMQVPKGVSIV